MRYSFQDYFDRQTRDLSYGPPTDFPVTITTYMLLRILSQIYNYRRQYKSAHTYITKKLHRTLQQSTPVQSAHTYNTETSNTLVYVQLHTLHQLKRIISILSQNFIHFGNRRDAHQHTDARPRQHQQWHHQQNY